MPVTVEGEDSSHPMPDIGHVLLKRQSWGQVLCVLFHPNRLVTRLPVRVDGSAQRDSTAPTAPYSSLPEPELYPSLSGDGAQASASSSDYQSLLPLDVNCILKPNSFDIAKMEEPAGRKQ